MLFVCGAALACQSCARGWTNFQIDTDLPAVRVLRPKTRRIVLCTVGFALMQLAGDDSIALACIAGKENEKANK